MLKDCMRFIPALMLGGVLPGNAPAGNGTTTYPERPVTLVVGYAPGGSADTLARLLAPYLVDDLGHSVVVENRPGAAGNIAAESVMRTDADGHTLLLISTAHTVNRTLYKKLNYDLIQDFTPVGMVAAVSNVLVVHPDIPARSLPEFSAYAKAHPNELSCASSGIGSTTHLSCELFKIATQTNILHVPYRGSAPAIMDVIGGQVTAMFDNLPTSLPHIQTGKLRAIGVTTAQRDPLAPDIPTLAETGLPGFAIESWFGFVARSGTKPEVIARLNDALRRALRNPEVHHAYAQAGFRVPGGGGTPEAFGTTIAEEIERWAEVVEAAKLSTSP